MCKEMLVLLFNKVVDPKSKEMEGQGGGEAQGVAAPPQKKVGHKYDTHHGFRYTYY
jgi:hypothetical protein